MFNDDRFVDWLEYRVKRAGDENAALIAKVNRRTYNAKWPGDSYKVLVRWPTDVEFIPRNFNEENHKEEAQAFFADALRRESENLSH
jgi:hypothetical protein